MPGSRPTSSPPRRPEQDDASYAADVAAANAANAENAKQVAAYQKQHDDLSKQLTDRFLDYSSRSCAANCVEEEDCRGQREGTWRQSDQDSGRRGFSPESTSHDLD